MWIINNFKNNITALEKFFVERIIQRIDFGETISNKHRTSNGYTQLKEIIQGCEITYERNKSVFALIRLMEEAKSPFIKQNILSDIIIDKYFKNFKNYIENYDEKKLENKRQPDLARLTEFEYRLKIFENQLDKFYFDSLKKELTSIDFSESSELRRNMDLISNLIDLLIPYLVFKGYSISTFSEILKNWINKGADITVSRFIKILSFEKNKYSFIQWVSGEEEEIQGFKKTFREILAVEIRNIEFSSLSSDFVMRNKLISQGAFLKYEYLTVDPQNHIRTTFDKILKDIVCQREAQSLAILNNYFQFSFWCKGWNQNPNKHKKVDLEGDSINVAARGRTLRETLIKLSKREAYSFKFDKEDLIPKVKINELQNAIYYYNLALGSKSIENSLSLLWTALETIQPNKIFKSDIEAVQNFVSKGLSIGAIARNIYSLGLRIILQNSVSNNCFQNLNLDRLNNIETKQGLKDWFLWLSEEKESIKRFEELKEVSELLAFSFCKISIPVINNYQDFLYNRLIESNESIKFQLARIYSHRNKIVHSGDMINEYTNLWMHLEWYVGKMLAYFIIQVHFLKRHDSLKSAYMELEADYDYLLSYLEINKDKKIDEISPRIIDLLFRHPWQAF